MLMAFAFSLGVDPNLIKMLGDWRSDAYLMYEQVTESRRLKLPEAMAKAVMKGQLDNSPWLAV